MQVCCIPIWGEICLESGSKEALAVAGVLGDVHLGRIRKVDELELRFYPEGAWPPRLLGPICWSPSHVRLPCRTGRRIGPLHHWRSSVGRCWLEGFHVLLNCLRDTASKIQTLSWNCSCSYFLFEPWKFFLLLGSQVCVIGGEMSTLEQCSP